MVTAGYAVGQLVNRNEYQKGMYMVESQVDKVEKKVDVLWL